MASEEQTSALRRTAIVAMVVAVLASIADVTGLVAFGTGKSLPELLGPESSESPPNGGSEVADGRQTTPSAPTTDGSSTTTNGVPSTSTAPSSTPPTSPATAAPSQQAPPSASQIADCLERWSSVQVTQGVPESDMGAPVSMQVHVDPADQPYTLWITDAGCDVAKVSDLAPGSDFSFETWGGAMWDMTSAGREPFQPGMAQVIDRLGAASTYTFEVGSTTLRYQFQP